MNTRQMIDRTVSLLIRSVSFFSVLALVAMLFFLFIQGIEPFIRPTANGLRLVVQNIDSIEINGTLWENQTRFIPVDTDARTISVSFQNQGEAVSFTIGFDPENDNPKTAISFPAEYASAVSYPEAYTHTITFPGMVTGLEQTITVLQSEPPYSPAAFLGGFEWRPTHLKLYGILTMIVATILTTIGAVVIGVPLALLSAVLIAEFLPKNLATIIRSAIDLLAGIPSVVYGFFGLMMVVPLVQRLFNSASGSSLIAAVFILSIMVLPTISAITMTSLQAVPSMYREASLAVGASKMQTAWRVVFPAAKSGILAGIILGISRAIGETMAVILVAGNSPQIPRALSDSVRTLTATIALEMGYAQGRHSQILFSIGIVLFVMILTLNAIILRLKKQVTEAA